MTQGRQVVLHPILAAIVPLAFLYQHNIELGATLSEFALWAVAFVLLALLSWGAFRLVTGEWVRSALLASFTTFALLTYGHFWMALSGLHVRFTDQLLPAYSLLVLVPWIALVGGGLFLLARMRKNLSEFTTLAHAVLAVLLVTSVIGIATAPEPVEPKSVTLGTTEMVADPAVVNAEARPNVYYIVLDEYARADVLMDEFGFDNRPFLDALEARGLDVASESHANYRQTFLSLASTLNMAYLDPLVEQLPKGSIDERPVYGLIEQSRVFDAFQGAGYELVTFDSGFQVTQENARSDHHIDCGVLDTVDQMVMRTTLLAMLDEEVAHRSLHARINCILGEIASLPEFARERDAPVFTFAHLVNPHGPYVFDENGGYVGPHEVGPEEEPEAYIAQVKHINQRILDIVDEILAAESTPPVIVISSDHGVRFLQAEGEWDEERTRQQFGTLNAMYLPGVEDPLRDNVSNVNLFRVVLPHVLGVDLEPLPDRAWAGEFESPYEWQDVTDRLREDAGATSAD